MTNQRIASGENPRWTAAKLAARDTLVNAFDYYEMKSLGTASRPTDQNLINALEEFVSETIFDAWNSDGPSSDIHDIHDEERKLYEDAQK